jgi:hypothetical protein
MLMMRDWFDSVDRATDTLCRRVHTSGELPLLSLVPTMNDLIGSVAIAVERRSWPALQPLFHRLAALPADTVSVAGASEFDSICAAVKALPASEDADATRACSDLIKVAQRALDAKHNASIPAVLSNSLYSTLFKSQALLSFHMTMF